MPTLSRKRTVIACVLTVGFLGLGLAAAAPPPNSAEDPDQISVEGPVLLKLNPPYGARLVDTEAPVNDNAPPAGEKLATGDSTEGPSLDAGTEKATNLPAEKPAATEKAASGNASTKTVESDALGEPNKLPVQPGRTLTPAQIALRDKVRRLMVSFFSQPLSMQDNTPTDILSACLPYGCQTEVLRGSNRVNGITGLCWDYPCAGFTLLKMADGHIAGRIGYGAQERPSQLLAVLAISRVQANYPMRVGEDVRTVADLAEHEKLSCRADADLSMKLIGLSYYVDEPTWKNSLGEEWSVEKMMGIELAKPIVTATPDGAARLMGLSYAIDRRIKRRQPLDGQFARAQKFTTDFQDHALGLQNPDGSWNPRFFTVRGVTHDTVGQLRSTGHILEWLVFSLPYQRLDDPRVVRSVEYVAGMLASQRYQNSIRALNSREIDSAMHALRALDLYDERVFEPADPPKTEAPAAPDAKAAAKRPSVQQTR